MLTGYDAHDYDLVALDSVIDSYDVCSDPVLAPYWPKLCQSLWNKIGAYGHGINDYGQVMQGHLERISTDGRDFMLKLGYSEQAAANFYDAFRLSDIGKLHSDYDVGIWSLPHRPTEVERREKSLHTLRGPAYLNIAYKQAGLPDEVINHPHLAIVIPALMLYHHERLTGSGYGKKNADELGNVIRLACIVDAYDGDRIQRPHQPAKRTPAETIDRMMAIGKDQKYANAFDARLLNAYRGFKL